MADMVNRVAYVCTTENILAHGAISSDALLCAEYKDCYIYADWWLSNQYAAFLPAPTDAQTVQIRQILNEVLLQSDNYDQ